MMKPFFILCLFFSGLAFAQNDMDVSEQFSLEAALDLFKSSSNVENFERLLNQEGNAANNLDLNQDQTIDYVQVDDLQDGDTHVLLLYTTSENGEKTGVAQIYVEKTADAEAQIQIVGDEDLFGPDAVVEPSSDYEKPAYSRGPAAVDEVGIWINVWTWPSVRWIYGPSYRLWKSYYRWNNYPRWWKPYRPATRVVFVNRASFFRKHYHTTKVVRIQKGHHLYKREREIRYKKTFAKGRTKVFKTKNKHEKHGRRFN